MKQKRMGRAIWMAFLLAALLTLTAMAGDVQATVPQLETPALGQWSNAAIGWTAVDEAQYYNVVLYHAETMGGTLTRVDGITKTKNEYTVPRTAYETYQTGCFYVKVQARTPDSTMYTSSDWVTSAPLAADSLRALETPGNVRWLREAEDFDAEGVDGAETVSLKPGTLVWDAVEGAGEYMVSLYRGQTPVAPAELLGDGYPGYTNPRMNYCDFYLDYLEPGNQYYFTVRACPARDPYDGYPYYSEFAYSATLDYRPEMQLDAPTNFRWEGKTLFWDAPAGDLDGYWVTWYHADTLDGEKTELRTGRVFSDSSATVYSQETSGYLFAKVRARSADVLDVAYSDWSDFSPAYSIGDLPQLETPANVQWVTASHSFEAVDSDSTKTVMVYPGFATWAPVSSAYSYQVTLSCGGKAVLDTTAYSNYYDFTKAICANGSGVYTVTVTAKSLGSDYQPSNPSQPVAWQYEEPAEALAAPSDLLLQGVTARWSATSQAGRFELNWYFRATQEQEKKDTGRGSSPEAGASAAALPRSVLERYGAGYYSFGIQAVTGDIAAVRSSDWVYSKEVYLDPAGSSYSDAVKASLTLVAQAVSAQEAQSMALEQIGTDNLLAAMEADPSVAQKIQQLEQKLQLTTEVNSTVPALPASMVEVAGAALNVQAGATDTTLNIRAAQATALPAEYAGMEAMLFSMSLTNVDESADGHQYLSIPVQITLPIPADYAPGQVKLLHRLTDADWIVLTPEVTEQDGRWYASVVVTQLSDFAIAADRSASSVVMTVAGEIQVAAGDMPEQTAFICVAVYDCQGRMVAVARTAVKPGQNVYALNAGLDAPPQGGEVRAFFLDAQNAPTAPCCKYLL